MKQLLSYLAASVILVVAITACNEGVVGSTDGDTEEGVSLVSVYLTDAPGDVAAVWVEVEEIYLQGGSEGRVYLLDEPTELIELTSLVGLAEPLVLDAEVESDRYGQLRFVIGGAVLEAADGSVYSKDGTAHPEGLPTTGELHCPSCSQSGIKVVLQGDDITFDGGADDLLLDFDVTQTFGHRAGQSGRWIMRPVIHGVRMVEMGRISGTVALATDDAGEPVVTIPECPAGTPRTLADFVPTAFAVNLTDDEGSPIVRTGVTDADGNFRIYALAPDDYELSYLGQLQFESDDLVWDAEVEPFSVTVPEGTEVTDVAYTITGASCVPVGDTDA
ncbi:MAG: DUF4382 domain-containing protein [Gemmatimonadales bacterium]|nr:MAG: DUF4382 domain-containing protein [Gemmatimonadales bacterium]